jgi:outer membrane lipoprotein
MKRLYVGIALIALLLLAGCAAMRGPDLVPGELKGELDRDLSLSEVRQAPEDYAGRVVLWGGTVIQTMNRENATLIEIVQLPLDRSERPRDVDSTQGRFLIRSSEYLDPYIFRRGREVTVVGELAGTETMTLGDVEYTYPVVRAANIRLWEQREEKVRVYHDYPRFHYWYGPWRHPYWW